MYGYRDDSFTQSSFTLFISTKCFRLNVAAQTVNTFETPRREFGMHLSLLLLQNGQDQSIGVNERNESCA